MDLKLLSSRLKLAKRYAIKREIERVFMEDEFYGVSIMDQVIIDRFKYKGKGRPRKVDYISIREAQRQLNTISQLKISKLQIDIFNKLS